MAAWRAVNDSPSNVGVEAVGAVPVTDVAIETKMMITSEVPEVVRVPVQLAVRVSLIAHVRTVDPSTVGGGSPLLGTALEGAGKELEAATTESAERKCDEGVVEALGAEATEEEESSPTDAPSDEPPAETGEAEPVDSPKIGGSVALGDGVALAGDVAGLVPPVAGARGAANRAGATPKPTIAISATTRVHHGFERLAVMTEFDVDSPQFIKP
jgi:hypothetical protein